jgi:hypothetical protein
MILWLPTELNNKFNQFLEALVLQYFKVPENQQGNSDFLA